MTAVGRLWKKLAAERASLWRAAGSEGRGCLADGRRDRPALAQKLPEHSPADNDAPAQLRRDQRYRRVVLADLPAMESLELTLSRVIPYWQYVVVPNLNCEGTVLVVAHGNTLLVLSVFLDGMPYDNVATYPDRRKRTARTVLTGWPGDYAPGRVTRHGSNSPTRLTGQSAITDSTWRR